MFILVYRSHCCAGGKNQTQAGLISGSKKLSVLVCNEGCVAGEVLVSPTFKTGSKITSERAWNNLDPLARFCTGDWERFGQYDRYRKVKCEYVLRQTSTEHRGS